MDVIGAVKTWGSAVANYFGYQKHRLELNNSPEMQKRDRIHKQNQEMDNVVKMVSKKDLDEERKQLSR